MKPRIIMTVVVIVAIVAAVALASATAGSASQPVQGAQPVKEVETKSGGACGLIAAYDLNLAGKSATLSEVMASAKLAQLTYLPLGSSQPQIKMSDDGNLAVLIYTNPKLARIDFYKQDVQIVIISEKDGTSFEDYKRDYDKYTKTGYYPVTITVTEKNGTQQIVNTTKYVVVPNRAIVSVAGNPGFATEQMHTTVHENGRVQWWTSDGIHYQVIANLPVQELLKIAELMPGI